MILNVSRQHQPCEVAYDKPHVSLGGIKAACARANMNTSAEVFVSYEAPAVHIGNANGALKTIHYGNANGAVCLDSHQHACTVKDLCFDMSWSGIPSPRDTFFKSPSFYAGSAMLEGFTADVDATVVTRILDAGGTITGKVRNTYVQLNISTRRKLQQMMCHVASQNTIHL